MLRVDVEALVRAALLSTIVEAAMWPMSPLPSNIVPWETATS